MKRYGHLYHPTTKSVPVVTRNHPTAHVRARNNGQQWHARGRAAHPNQPSNRYFVVETMGIEPTAPCLHSNRLRSGGPW